MVVYPFRDKLHPWITCPPKKGPFQKGKDHLPTIIFQARTVSFRGSTSYVPKPEFKVIVMFTPHVYPISYPPIFMDCSKTSLYFYLCRGFFSSITEVRNFILPPCCESTSRPPFEKQTCHLPSCFFSECKYLIFRAFQTVSKFVWGVVFFYR